MRVHEPQIAQNLIPQAGQDPSTVHEVDCPECKVCTRQNRVLPQDLVAFVAGVLGRHRVPDDEAAVTARSLVAADTRGIPSHGVARLSRYLSGIQRGHIVPGAPTEIEEVAPSVARVDAHDGLGQVASQRANDWVIARARTQGIAMATVRRSNHYGIAGYWALQAVDAGLIGISTTNSAPLVVPTFGADALIGTNPLAFGAPAERHGAFLLDMATSVVPRGKLEVYDRNRKQMPDGWAVDEQGYDCQNPAVVLKNLIGRVGGGILPLGGRGELFSGYKGYGLAVMVDILSGVLSGAGYGPDVDDVHRAVGPGEKATPNVGHFFLALDPSRFMPMAEFRARMDDLMSRLKDSKKALDQERIFVHGEKEVERAREHEATGIPIARNVMCALVDLARDCGAAPPRMQPDLEPAS